MDFVGLKKRISEGVSKYKYVWIVLLTGVVLMMIPGKSTQETQTQQTEDAVTEITIEQQLEQILSQLQGAGHVKVMLTIAQGERTIYQTDSSYTQGENSADSRTQTILITDSERNETGLVHQINPPTYQGAIVLAQGGDDPVVKLAIVDAVCKVTGLGADKISVLKMQ